MVKHSAGKPCPIIAINLVTGKKIYYNSISEAARECACCEKSIYNVLHNEYKRTGLYTFKYADKLKPIKNEPKKTI